MPQKSISSLELVALVHELQFLVHGKLTNIYHPQEKELLFQVHVPNKSKQLLKIIPGKWLCLTQRKETTVKPSSFCMQLRKYIDNASIRSLQQKDSERIVIFELEKEKRFFLIIELFSKGNVVLTDENLMIIGVLEQQVWKDRAVKPKGKYAFPPVGVHWKALTQQQLFGLLQSSQKRNLATALAADIGLGGIYAEELCARAGISKDILPVEITLPAAKELIRSLQEMISSSQTPQGYVYAEQVTPFPLQGATPLKIMETYNEAIDSLIPFVISSPYEKRIRALELTITGQEESLQQFHKEATENTSKGELIYGRYAPLQRLLEIVKELRKTKSWNEISAELRKEKRIKEVNLKDKKIMLDL